jgi:RNA polymerase sigma factor (sigma-70 family)
MTDAPDAILLEEFAKSESEEAFTELVRRHIGLVHSVALRHTQNAQHAEEITQAVFIILARKASSLGRKTILSGWLYHTARLTAANFQRAEFRRARREQEVFMQSPAHDEQIDSAWRDLGPLLEEAMSKLRDKDRDAIVMRFFENKSLREVGTAMGLEERAAQKRVARGLEKLRTFFTKRGVTLSGAVIAGAVAANSVQAAPVGLLTTVSTVAVKETAVTASTLTLVKGALKLMAWTKAKLAIAAGVGVLVAAGATVAIEKTISYSGEILEQRLPDGSELILNKLSYGTNNIFYHGGKTLNPGWQGRYCLVAEFKIIADNPDAPMLKPKFYRQYRCVVRGEQGIEFVEEFSGATRNGGFTTYPDGTFAYIMTSTFPRDSRWLWFRFEQSETNNPYGPWEKVAEFKIKNPASPILSSWTAGATPATNSADGKDFVLDEVTVQLLSTNQHDIWAHLVSMPTHVYRQGESLTNWGIAFGNAEDASGNWNPGLPSQRSLDPRYVWKLDMDFEPQSDFASSNLATVDLPNSGQFSTEVTVMGMPVKISWDGSWVEASMPTNRPDLALNLVKVTDAEGRTGQNGSGNWNQYHFRKGSFLVRLPDGTVTWDFKPATVTVAVVPNVHTTFYVQPKLLSTDAMQSTAAP